MITKLTDTGKAAIYSVLVLLMAVGAASLIRTLDLTDGMTTFVLWESTPTVAALVMLLVVTRDGYSREGWKSLGLHRLGLSVWWIAFGGTLLITVAASAVVWATPLASFVLPKGGIADPAINFLISVVLMSLTFMLAEEIGFRGYLQPHLMSLGRSRALLLVGLVWATWHMPLIFLTPLYHAAGNRLIVLPLFVGTIVAASFFFGYLRIYTGSVWPASIAHSVKNASWDIFGPLTATSSPVLVNEYLAGDTGILILLGAVIGVVLVGRMLKRGMDEAQSGREAPEVIPGTPRAMTAPR